MHNKKSNKRKALEDVKHIVENVLNNFVEISDDDDIEGLTLEEAVTKKDIKADKKYVNNFEDCGYEIEANMFRM